MLPTHARLCLELGASITAPLKLPELVVVVVVVSCDEAAAVMHIKSRAECVRQQQQRRRHYWGDDFMIHLTHFSALHWWNPLLTLVRARSRQNLAGRMRDLPFELARCEEKMIFPYCFESQPLRRQTRLTVCQRQSRTGKTRSKHWQTHRRTPTVQYITILHSLSLGQKSMCMTEARKRGKVHAFTSIFMDFSSRLTVFTEASRQSGGIFCASMMTNPKIDASWRLIRYHTH